MRHNIKFPSTKGALSLLNNNNLSSFVIFSKIDYFQLMLNWVFANNYRGFRLKAKSYWWWSLLILLLFVASIRRKLLKTTHTEESSIHTNSESCNIHSDRKQINSIPNKSFRYYNLKSLNNFSTHSYIVDIS